MHTVIQSVTFSSQPASRHTHYHDCHEIIFITQGAAEFSTASEKYTAKSGDLILFSRFEEHSVISKTNDYRRYVLQISPDIPTDPTQNRVFSILFNRPERFSNVLHCGSDGHRVGDICACLLEESRSTAPFREDMLNLLTQQLLTLLCRRAPALSAVLQDSSFEIVRRIQQRLEISCSETTTLEQLSQEFGFSASHLSHMFKRITGTSVMGYLQACRLALAKKQLVQTNLPVGAVAAMCGFADASNFTRTFRSVTGCTPTQFRQQYRH